MAMTLLLALIPAAYVLTLYFLSHRRRPKKAEEPVPDLRSLRRLMRRALRTKDSQPGLIMLRRNAQALTESLLQLKQDLRYSSWVPHRKGMTKKQLHLARHLLEAVHDPALLLRYLRAWPESLTLRERNALPLGIRLLLAQELEGALADILADAKDQRLARSLARRMSSSRQPQKALQRRRLSFSGADALMTALRSRDSHAAAACLEEYFSNLGTSSTAVTRQHAKNQACQADAISRLASAFRAVDQTDWSNLLESADPLHTLMSSDSIYAAMDSPSRAYYRRQASSLSRFFRVTEESAVQCALSLAANTSSDSLESHVGWYLTEPEGMATLRKALPSKRGWMAIFFFRHRFAFFRASLWLSNIIASLAFLRAGYSLWLLPLFLPVFGCLARFLLRRLFPDSPLPCLKLDTLDEDMRTLLVLPAVLHDRHEAIRAARQLRTLRQSQAGSGIDCLLLGDWPPSMTQRSGEDADIILAAQSSIDALNDVAEDDTRYYYLQRSRVWSSRFRIHLPYGGRFGAIQSLCQLLSHEESNDGYDASSISPDELRQRYAWILTVDRDTRLDPSLLLHMAGTLAHPLCERRHTHRGPRGFSMLSAQNLPLPVPQPSLLQRLYRRPLRSGSVTLIRPSALIEDMEGRIDTEQHRAANRLWEALAGHGHIIHSAAFHPTPPSVNQLLLEQHDQCRDCWAILPWQLSHVQTPRGVERNPLGSQSRFHLREQLRFVLLPLCQIVIVCASVLHHDLLLLLFVLSISVYSTPWSQALAEFMMLPARAWSLLDASVRALLSLLLPGRNIRELSPERLSSIQIWSQAIFAALIVWFSALSSPWFLPGFVLAIVHVCFPIIQSRLDSPAEKEPELSSTDLSLLQEIAASTWRSFDQTVDEETHHLPPDHHQLQPAASLSDTTSPESIAMYLLSCLAAAEAELIDLSVCAQRMADLLNSLESFPRIHGLLHETYSLSSLEPAAKSRIFAASNGLLCAALLTAAQGMRAHLAELDEPLHHLPSRLDAFASSMKLSALYDEAAGFFREWLDPENPESNAPYLHLFSDEGLLLSFTAVMRREIPAEHLTRLHRSRVRLSRTKPLLTRQGGADALLPTLLLPTLPSTLMEHMARTHAWAQRRAGRDDMYGLGRSACYAFDSRLQYVRQSFGLADISLEHTEYQPVFAPWACALCLPFDRTHAMECLRQMRAVGMMGRQGFLESIDFSATRLPEGSEYALVRMQTALHQGIILCATCSLLTGNVLMKHFTALPMADASVLLLRENKHPLVLPSPTLFSEPEPQREGSFRRPARVFSAPLDAHVLGSARAGMLISSHGSSVMRFSGQNVTSFSGDASVLEGLQLYLMDKETVYRLFDPALPGETYFSEGAAHFIRQCNTLKCSVTLLTDPSADALLHMIEITNEGPLECTIDLADCLLPAMDAPAEHPEAHTLTLDMDDCILVHSLHTDESLLNVHVQSDRSAFLGRGGSLHKPASLSTPSQPGVENAFQDVCLSFRIQMSIGAHSSRRLTLSTRLQETQRDVYTPADLSSQLTIARLHARSLSDSLFLSQEQVSELSTLIGAVLWHEQPHQGADSALRIDSDHLNLPPVLLTLQLFSAEGMELLQETEAFTEWLRLTGFEVSLCVDCPEELQRTVNEELPIDANIHILTHLSDDERATLHAASRLVLTEGCGSAAQQAASLRTEFPHSVYPAPTADVVEESDNLLFDNGVSGFDPQTGDCIMYSDPVHAAPRRWRNLLSSSRFSTLNDDGGIRESFASCVVAEKEYAFVSDAETGSLCSVTPEPLGQNLHWQIRHSPGVSSWHSAFSGLKLTLTAASMPRHACGIRTLRLRNSTSRERRLTLHIAVFFSIHANRQELFLTPLVNSISAQHPAVSGSGFLALAEGDCEVFSCSLLGFQGFTQFPAMHSDPKGSVGVLTVPVTIAPGGSQAITWLTGYAAQSDDLELMLRRVHRSGASAVYRSVRQQWAQRMGMLTFDTPEASLNLLLNHWLPCQFLSSREPLTLPACSMLNANHVRPQLLLMARDHIRDDLLPWLSAYYVRISGDEAALNDLVPHDVDHPEDARDTLYARCLQALHTPADDLHTILLRIIAISAFLPWADAPDAEELQRLQSELTARIDEIPSDAFSAALGTLALSATPDTASVMRDCYHRLFDSSYGILRMDDSPGAPQDTLAAVWFLAALSELGWNDYTWTILRALNPIHHTDDPYRTEEYRAEPYAMPASVISQPPHTGRASTRQSAEAAGLLYAIITEKLLGIQRRGSHIELHPMLPEEWDSCTVTLRWGTSTWHIEYGDHDGPTSFELEDDGQVHHIRVPIRTAKPVPVS